MNCPQRATVRPRIHAPYSGEIVPLEDEVLGLIEAGRRAVVTLVGGPGSGKTTALLHLWAVLPSRADVLLLDEPNEAELSAARKKARLVVRTHRAGVPVTVEHQSLYRLAAWNKDDLIEYLIGAHRDRCESVLARLRPTDFTLLGGVPEVWRVVLETLAAHGGLPGARAALLLHLKEACQPNPDLLEWARGACLNAVVANQGVLHAKLPLPGPEQELMRLTRHPAVRLLLAVERLAANLRGDGPCDHLAQRLPRELVGAVAAEVAGDQQVMDRLSGLLAGPPASHAMAASILHARGGWTPAGPIPLLTGAYLDGARWPGVRLPRADLVGTDLSGADLRDADLTEAQADNADLSGVQLAGAKLFRFRGIEANLEKADLSRVRAEAACFVSARLGSACLDEACLHAASLQEADLTGASLRGANLSRANLEGARVEGADFSGADLSQAILEKVRLREAVLRGANFGGACLIGSDLEGVDLSGACFRDARLSKALLTGTFMPGADFHHADLTDAGLAEIDWEGADLSGADLRGASFHLGSSRSGLVGSLIACEGSKTGFYTDDYQEQGYKSPEEIRKANLCGADLRGARLDGVDFYLVDLRGARYDAEHARHLRRCGAILEARR